VEGLKEGSCALASRPRRNSVGGWGVVLSGCGGGFSHIAVRKQLIEILHVFLVERAELGDALEHPVDRLTFGARA